MPAPGTTTRGLLGAGLGLIGFSAIAGLLVTVMVAPAIAVTGITASNSIGVFQSLPDYITIDDQHQRNEFVAINGKGEEVHIATIFDQNREDIPLEEMDEDLLWAAIDGEDRRFYEHGGVDVPSLVRAAIGQATDTSSSGASTLTMQLVRNILVLRAANNTEVSDEEREELIRLATYPDMNRKLKEMKLAISLEKSYTKEQILEAYLNIVGMGSSTYGVEAAAQRFFSTSAKDLTPAQAASLVAIVQNPNMITLIYPENYERNEKRRNVILGWMLNQNHLTQEEYDEAIATPVDEDFLKPSPPKNGCTSAPVAFRYPCDYALKSIYNGDVTALGATPKEQRDNFRAGGYKIVLSIDPSLQKKATETAKQYAPASESRFRLGAAVASTEVKSGRILVMAQNKTFDDTGEGDKRTTTAVNFVADQRYGGGSGFQPGSTYKPFTLLSFLSAGHGVNESFNASILELKAGQFQDCNGESANIKFRNDAGEKGSYTVVRGTAGSVNSVFLQMATKVDQCDTREIARSIGVHRADGAPDGSDLHTRPSCAIGGCENNIAPLTMSAAYAAIANKGVYCKPRIIDNVISPQGEELGGQPEECGQSLVSPAVANAAVYAMSAVMTGTAAASNPNDGTPYFGKTGTTDSSWHTWMVGSSSRVSTAVWVGNIVGKQPLRQIYVNGIQASVLRHFIFKPLALAIDAKYPGKAFPAPDPSLLTGTPVFVPEVIGMTAEKAKEAIKLAELNYNNAGKVDSDAPAGTVVRTDPPGGASVPKGTTVKVYISNGNGIPVPDVIGLDFASGAQAFNDLGYFNVSEACVVAKPSDDPATIDTIVKQTPKSNRMSNVDAQVTLTVRKIACP